MTYDPREVSYERLLSEFFQRVDPTTRNRQARLEHCKTSSCLCRVNGQWSKL